VLDGQTLEKAVITVKGPEPKSATKLVHAGFLTPSLAIFDGIDATVKSPLGASNPAFLIIADAPVVSEIEPNNSAEKPQAVTTPCTIAGRIDSPGDRDCFAFSAKKGETLAIEAFGDRFSMPMDLRISISDAKGKVLLDADDSLETAPSAFFTRSDDPPMAKFTAPEDGTYVLTVVAKDSFSSFGPRHAYLVRLAPPQPDFTVVALPASQTSPEGAVIQEKGTYGWNILVFPQGGFSGTIRIEGVDLPAGVTMQPQTIRMPAKLVPGKGPATLVPGKGPTTPTGTVVMSAANGSYVGPIKLIATAEVAGRKIVHEVRAGGMTWPVAQAGTPAIARLERELVVAVSGKAEYALQWTQPEFKAAAGEPVKVGVKLIALQPNFKTPVQIAPVTTPPGLTAQPLTLTPGKDTGVLILDAKGTGPAGKFSLVLRGQTAPPPKQQATKASGPPNVIQYSPPIDVTLIPKQVVKITPPTPLKLSPGKSVEVSLKLVRQFDYEGAFSIEPDAGNPKGIRISAAKAKEGEDTAKLTVTAEPGAPAGPAMLSFRIVADFDGMSIVHEGKLQIVIAK